LRGVDADEPHARQPRLDRLRRRQKPPFGPHDELDRLRAGQNVVIIVQEGTMRAFSPGSMIALNVE
jgi:hypothetical protein